MKINMKKEVQIDVAKLKIHCKVCDSFTAELLDVNNDVLKDYEGYVPSFMPGEHYGDYLMLDIDIETGAILNWKKIKPEELENFISGEEQ